MGEGSIQDLPSSASLPAILLPVGCPASVAVQGVDGVAADLHSFSPLNCLGCYPQGVLERQKLCCVVGSLGLIVAVPQLGELSAAVDCNT